MQTITLINLVFHAKGTIDIVFAIIKVFTVWGRSHIILKQVELMWKTT